MQKIREKKSKRAERVSVSENETPQMYEPENPTDEIEKKVYQQSPITYTIDNGISTVVNILVPYGTIVDSR